jgi:SAM-dependent methyltransferase
MVPMQSLTTDPLMDDAHDLVGGEPETLGPWQISLMRQYGLQPLHRLLDLGSGTLRGGLHFIQFLDKGNYVGVEPLTKLVDIGRDLLQKTNMNNKSPLLGGFDILEGLEKVDYALTQSVINHLDSVGIEETVNRIAAVLKPGGYWVTTGVFTEDVDGVLTGERHSWRPNEWIVSRIGRSWFENVVNDHGLSIVEWTDIQHPRGQEVVIISKPLIGSKMVSEPWLLSEVPCLHRIHSSTPQGAHEIQTSIGMSLPLENVVGRLNKLSDNITTLNNHRKENRRALVTFDDGWRDVLLLRETFSSLPNLQPVLFIPSHQLRGVLRQLPLTCLYAYCAEHGIDPNNPSLGEIERSTLKSVSEQEQYARLRDAGIDIDLSTDDLLTMDDIESLSSEGWLICSHGPDHSDLRKASFESIKSSFAEDVAFLLRKGWAPWFAWPEGKCSGALADTLHEFGFTFQFGLKPPKEGACHPQIICRIVWGVE